jgi:hypothetical protein
MGSPLNKSSEKFWDMGRVNWDMKALDFVRKYCKERDCKPFDGVPILIHELASKELEELKYISTKFSRRLQEIRNLRRSDGAIRDTLRVYDTDWIVLDDTLSDIIQHTKGCRLRPDSYFQSLIKEASGGEKE